MGGDCAEAQEIARSHEVVDAATVVEAHFRLAPAHALAEPHLVDQADDVAVAAEKVVVEDLQPVAADLERPGLAAELRSRFEQRHLVALLCQPVCGREARDPSADDAVLHSSTIASVAPAFARPRRTSPRDRLIDQRK